MSGIRTHNIIGIGTDCIGSCKANYDHDHDHDGLIKQAHNRSNIQKLKNTRIKT